MDKLRIPIALLAFAIWLAIMVWGAWNPHDPATLTDGISGQVSPHMLGAAALLLVAVLVMRWWDVGFNAPRPWASLRILLLPGIYLVLFLIGALVIGLPPVPVIVFLALNCLLVGFSEELMFRGVLFRAFRGGMALWPAIWLTSAVFGSVHVLNGFTTGDWFSAAIQACTAFMAGTFFLAVLLRTGSILPGMLFHACWDFLLTATMAGHPAAEAAAAAPSPMAIFLPFLLEAPLFIYSVVLLRKLDPAPRPIAQAL